MVKLDDRMSEVGHLIKSNEADMKNLTTMDSQLHSELVTAEGQAKSQIEGVKKTMSGLEKTAAQYTSEIETEADKQQRQLTEQKAYLEKQQQEMIDELAKENQKQIQQTAAKVEENVKAEEDRVKLQEEDDDQSLVAMNARLGTQEAQVEAGHKANQDAMQNAENDVHLMESELEKDAAQVKKVAEYGKEALKSEEMTEQGQM